MTLSFPNQSRSYDSRQHCVRFWAYDHTLEIPFFIEANALCHIDPKTAEDGPGLLSTFDLHRTKILKAAQSVYVRHGRDAYRLAASDMK